MSLWDYANPLKFSRTISPVLPWLFAAAGLVLGTGLIWGFFFTPPDYRMGHSVKIIFVHVPTATMAINCWLMMVLASVIWVVRRHHVSALAAKAAAPVGAVMTLLGLITGAIWGQTTWTTWWEWDPLLTSFLVLFLFYLGYMALWQAIEDPDTAADLTAVLCLVGSIFALLSRYAVYFWSNSLHQPPSLSLDAEENVENTFWIPLVICLAGFFLLVVALVLLRTRTEIEARRTRALQQRQARAEVRT